LCVIQVRLIDASFMWTEPHSKRIKVKLVVQKEVTFWIINYINVKKHSSLTNTVRVQ